MKVSSLQNYFVFFACCTISVKINVGNDYENSVLILAYSDELSINLQVENY